MNKIFEQLLEKRGLGEDFLHPVYEKLEDPFLLPDMEKAISRIELAVSRGEKVLVYGDYDVDGVTASTVMRNALSLAGVADVEIMLPNRFTDGYGMSKKIINRAVDGGFALVVTVDCGSSNADIVDELNKNGVDVIVTDHHECPDVLPNALAVVNPKRPEYAGFSNIAGVGVTFKVAQALVSRGLIPVGQEKWLLDLVLLGTVCDSMPLLKENRILGYYGMKVLAKTKRVGLTQLMKTASIKKIDSGSIGFQIGPRLNAAGRIKSPDIALNLLNTKSGAEAAKLAYELEGLNSERKRVQVGAVKEISERGIGDAKVIVECGDWHEGVLGIIAGRLVEEYKRPAFVLSEVEEGILKGSGRSFGDFNIKMALDNCRDTIIGGGGHAEACGVKLEKSKLAEFTEKVNDYYTSLKLVDQERYLQQKVDLVVRNLDDFTIDLIDDLKLLEPFGEGNSEPVFRLENAVITERKRMGAEGQHLALVVKGDGGRALKMLAFSAPEKWMSYMEDDTIDVTFRLVENEWNGVRSVEGQILEIASNYSE